MSHTKPMLNNLIVSKIYKNLDIDKVKAVKGEKVKVNNPQQRAKLIREWTKEGAIVSVIAQRLGVSYATVTKDAKKIGVKLNKKPRIGERTKVVMGYIKLKGYINAATDTVYKDVSTGTGFNVSEAKRCVEILRIHKLITLKEKNGKVKIIWAGK